MPTAFPPTPGRVPARSAALLALLLAGCVWNYGFAGGGFPPEIRTVAVLPFDNRTADPTLTAEINGAVREAVERRLGLRQAGENQADAIVTGTITRYEPDMPVAFQGNEQTNQVQVTRRQVQIVLTVRIVERETERVLWERSGLSVQGDYVTGNEAAGREAALQQLVQTIVDGAQSQW